MLLCFQTKKSSLIKKKQNSKDADEEAEPETCKFLNTGNKNTVFNLITAHTPISTQSSNSVVFGLQLVYFLSTIV